MLHKLKNAAARFASGVTVVVSGRTGAVHAVTVSAFSCVSLDPPLVLVCVNTNSKIADLIEGALNHLEVKKADELSVIREADWMARNWVQQRIAQK